MVLVCAPCGGSHLSHPKIIGVAPTEVVFSETTFPVWGILGNAGLKNSPFASCAGPLKTVGSVTVTGLVDAIGRR